MKTLLRERSERKIAGVCAGMGRYFDLDPVVFRLFFLASVFFGGLGVLAYVATWVLVPYDDATGVPAPVAARLHLSATDRRIAGVCGGLGEYFVLDPVWFRIGFVVLAFFTCGLGVLLYLALWLLIPRAPTSQDRTGMVVA